MSRLLVVDPDRCVLSGECIYNHPEHFTWSEDDSTAVPSTPLITTADDLRHAEQAAELCPAGAITIVDGAQ